MQVRKLMPIDQNSQQMEKLAKSNGTTVAICGFITCAVCEYLSEIEEFTENTFKNINQNMLTPYIDKAMKSILQRRRFQLKKYYKIMTESQKKSYLTDWVASFEICDYLESINDKMVNSQVYFFRQGAYDHPEALKDVKFQEKERVSEEQCFKGERFFYSSFNLYANHHKEEFENELKKMNAAKPVIIATDVGGHFNVTVLFGGQVYILDSLTSYKDTRYDSEILETISYLYKKSYLKDQ